MFRRCLLILCLFLSLTVSGFAQAQTAPRQVQALVTEIVQKETTEEGATNYTFKARTVYGEEFTVETNDSYKDVGGLWFTLKEGDKVNLRIVVTGDTNTVYFEDVVRTDMLWWIIGLFLAVTLAVGLLRGFLAIIGFFLTTGILFGFLFPQILAGREPILMTLIASVTILAINIHLAHGFKARTFFAFLGTVCGVGLTAMFSYLFTSWSRLSGLGTEEASMLMWEVPAVVNPLSIFMSAILLGAVGVLDDIAVSQSEIVGELQDLNPELTRKDLFIRAMRVGRHHIASTVNTLILVYVGAAMPMFLLAMHFSVGPMAFLNTQDVAEEIVSIVAGTTALVLTVPLATAFATIPKPTKGNRTTHQHGHG